jgi:glycosyltransferase involved in cell wall biosynthesis
MPKLILFFSSLNIGGIERMMLNLSHQFKESGIEVVIVLLKKDGPFLSLLPPEIQIIDLQEKKNTFYALPKLIQVFTKVKADAVLAAHPNVNFIAIIARLFTGTPKNLVITEHSHLTMASNSGSRLSLRYRPLMEKLLYPKATHIVAVSEGLADNMSEATGIPRRDISVIYNPIVTDKLLTSSKEPVPADLFHPSIPTVLGAGRLVDVKDFSTLIHAFAEVRSNRSARLLILGDGVLKENLQELANSLGLSNDICFPGAVINPFAYMARASVTVLSSKYEGFANVIVESMACGTPVVSTDCLTGPAEILDYGRFGRLVPIGDSHEMARAIEETLDDPVDPELLRQRAASFSVEHASNQYLNLLFPNRAF